MPFSQICLWFLHFPHRHSSNSYIKVQFRWLYQWLQMTFKLHLLTQFSSRYKTISFCIIIKRDSIARKLVQSLDNENCHIYIPICFGTGHGYRCTPKFNDDVKIVCKLLRHTDWSRSITWFFFLLMLVKILKILFQKFSE